MDHSFQNVVDPDTRLGRTGNRVGGVDDDGAFYFLAGPFDVGVRQVDLVDHRNDLQVLVHRHRGVRDGLGFHALARVHDEQRAFTSGQRPRDFVGEVHVAGRIDEVELVGLAVLSSIKQAHRGHLDRDASLALEVHAVEHLLLSLATDRAAPLDQPVGQGALAVVDVRDDAEVADVRLVHGGASGKEDCTAPLRSA